MATIISLLLMLVFQYTLAFIAWGPWTVSIIAANLAIFIAIKCFSKPKDRDFKERSARKWRGGGRKS